VVRITGRVQGVGYRYWTEQTARRLGLDGWVRNRSDGSVEALIAGEGAAVAEMLAAFRQGPPHSRVSGVATAPADGPAETGFRTLPTA